jgi:hypothetical protein
MRRRHAPSACAVGMLRRHAPSACAVGMRLRHASSANADAPLPSATSLRQPPAPFPLVIRWRTAHADGLSRLGATLRRALASQAALRPDALRALAPFAPPSREYFKKYLYNETDAGPRRVWAANDPADAVSAARPAATTEW